MSARIPKTDYNYSNPPKSIYVADFCTKEKGYGRKMMQEVIDKAAKISLPITLFPLTKAMPFYEKIGFVRDVHGMILTEEKCKELATKQKEWEEFAELEPEDGCFVSSNKTERKFCA